MGHVSQNISAESYTEISYAPRTDAGPIHVNTTNVSETAWIPSHFERNGHRNRNRSH